MHVLDIINYALLGVFCLLYAYQAFYTIVVWVKKPPKKPQSAPLKRYAVMVCGRNEAAVIRDLIGCIDNQTYPRDHLTVFVMADNCTDNTAEVAKAAGAIVYERNSTELVGKSYALEELITHIGEDYPGQFDGYFVFDADNILKTDYIEQMHLTLAAGNEIATSYRNSKNYGSNWVSAAHGVWFLHESRYLNEARYTLHCSCAISGTGYVFTQKVLDELDGKWPFHFMTEDVQFSAHQILHGRHIAYCPEAEFYDEQPLTFRQSYDQRKRWAKGNIEVFWHYKKDLIKGFFKGDFSCYDMLMAAIPAFVLTSLSLIVMIASLVVKLCSQTSFLDAILSVIVTFGGLYVSMIGLALITTITEWKKIYARTWQKIVYLFSFPIFMLSYIFIVYVVMFKKVTWVPIVHTESVDSLKSRGEMHVKDY